MSEFMEELAACPPIDEWMDWADERFAEPAWEAASAEESEPNLIGWAEAGLEESEWPQLTAMIGRLLIPADVPLQGSVWNATNHREKMEAVTLGLSRREDWLTICGNLPLSEEDRDPYSRIALAISKVKPIGFDILVREHEILRPDPSRTVGVDLRVELINPKIIKLVRRKESW